MEKKALESEQAQPRPYTKMKMAVSFSHPSFSSSTCSVSFPRIIIISAPKPSSATRIPLKTAINFPTYRSNRTTSFRKFIAITPNSNNDDQINTEADAELPTKSGDDNEEENNNKGEKGMISGVAEEIGEIEWPGFGKVVGTTGVVVGVIAGSSLVLLTVNALLAELSDRLFAGNGVQDFFG